MPQRVAFGGAFRVGLAEQPALPLSLAPHAELAAPGREFRRRGADARAQPIQVVGVDALEKAQGRVGEPLGAHAEERAYARAAIGHAGAAVRAQHELVGHAGEAGEQLLQALAGAGELLALAGVAKPEPGHQQGCGEQQQRAQRAPDAAVADRTEHRRERLLLAQPECGDERKVCDAVPCVIAFDAVQRRRRVEVALLARTIDQIGAVGGHRASEGLIGPAGVGEVAAVLEQEGRDIRCLRIELLQGPGDMCERHREHDHALQAAMLQERAGNGHDPGAGHPPTIGLADEEPLATVQVNAEMLVVLDAEALEREGRLLADGGIHEAPLGVGDIDPGQGAVGQRELCPQQRLARALPAFLQPVLAELSGQIVQLAEERAGVQRQGMRRLHGPQPGERLRLRDERRVRALELDPVAAEECCKCQPGNEHRADDPVGTEDGDQGGTRARQERGEGQVGFTDL